MTQVGGPAAINGFLYQIIHHIGWLAELRLAGTLDGQQVTDACLVLEPRTGGDARAEAASRYLVEQYKTRSDGTWSIAQINDVLRDLRKSVPSSLPGHAEYRFVTDGRSGRLEAFTAFLADIKAATGPAGIEAVAQRDFGNGLIATSREYFDRIVAETRSPGIEATEQEREIVFHLLSRFDMEFEAGGNARATQIERLLRRYAPDLGSEQNVREHLVGVLVERLSKGEVQLGVEQINELLRHVGLNPERVRRYGLLAESMGRLTAGRLESARYRPQRDVRDVPDWPADKHVLLISGESGAGKTWRLGRLLCARVEARQIVTFVHRATSRGDLFEQAARDFWQRGLGETSDRTLLALTYYLRELSSGEAIPELLVALDDVRDVDLARELVRQDWSDLGIRLAMTVPSAVAQAVRMTDGDVVHLHTVGNFTLGELDELLRRGGRRWADLPPDQRQLLRNPILAGLYLELPYTSFQSAPRSEYEILEGFWQRIATRGGSGDNGIALALGAHFLANQPYPLPRPMWGGIGLDSNATLTRLEAAGWLQSTENGEISFAHDRLLNWAIAKHVVSQFRSQSMSLDELTSLLADEEQPNRERSRRLGYLLMDVLWMLAEDENNKSALCQILQSLEAHRHTHHRIDELYEDLLPTLGERIVPSLLERLNHATATSDNDYHVHLIGKAFVNLASQENVRLNDAVSSLLNSSSPDHQDVAIAVLKAKPTAQYLDRLWEVHQERTLEFFEAENVSRHRDYEASSAALHAAVAQDPDWLRCRIASSDPTVEQVSELGYLLNRLEHPDASAIWAELGDVLIEKVPENRPRSILHCIGRFSDHTKLDFVVRHLTVREDFASGAALRALSFLNPTEAIDRLADVDEAERYFTRNDWLPVLLHTQPDLTRERILELAEASSSGRRLIEMIFAERPDEMDGDMLRFVLRAFEEELQVRHDEISDGDPGWLFGPLGFLAHVARPDLLKIIEAEAGGRLEELLTSVALSRLHTNSNYYDGVRENARRILLMIGGDGFATMIKRELESEHYWIRHSGLKWAYMCPNDEVVQQLSTIARRPVPYDTNGKRVSEPYFEFHQSVKALAALGADEALISALWENGVAEVPTSLAGLREHVGPLPKPLTTKALQTLQAASQDEAPSDAPLSTALAIAWLSGDEELIPAVRAILERADPESQVAGLACIALINLGDQSDEFAHLAQNLARSNKNTWWGLNALRSLDARGLERLRDLLQEQSPQYRAQYDDLLIRDLYRNPATREAAIDTAVKRCQHGRFHIDAPYDIAAEANDPGLREQIIDKAFAARSFVTTMPLRAIDGLAKFDADRAVEAIELALRFHPAIERELCRRLVRLAPTTAAAKLIQLVVSIERASLRRAAGRALRRLDPDEISGLLIEQLSGVTAKRKAAAELAGWVSVTATTDALSITAEHDSSPEVRHAALAALSMQRREETVRSLMSQFRSAPSTRRWGLFVTIVDIGDPFLLTDKSDPLWLGNILTGDVPDAFAEYATPILDRRKKEEERKK